MTQTLLFFEQALIDAAQEAKAAAAKAKAEALEKEQLAKLGRRIARDQAHRERTPDEVAQCGIRWYCRSPRDRATGHYWHNCHGCGKPLVYYASNEEAQAYNTEPCIRK